MSGPSNGAAPDPLGLANLRATLDAIAGGLRDADRIQARFGWVLTYLEVRNFVRLHGRRWEVTAAGHRLRRGSLLDLMGSMPGLHAAEDDDLPLEVVELRRDAARWRFLRDCPLGGVTMFSIRAGPARADMREAVVDDLMRRAAERAAAMEGDK